MYFNSFAVDDKASVLRFAVQRLHDLGGGAFFNFLAVFANQPVTKV
jgi:hypothetical protein